MASCALRIHGEISSSGTTMRLASYGVASSLSSAEKIFDCSAKGLAVNSASRSLKPWAVDFAAPPEAPTKGMTTPAPTRPRPTDTATKAPSRRARCGIREADMAKSVTAEPECGGQVPRRFGRRSGAARERLADLPEAREVVDIGRVC